MRQAGGALINIGSISGEVPAPILSAYTATKHAAKGFANSLRLEVMHGKAPGAVTLIKPSGTHAPFGQHALNYMDKESQVPPPVLVAEAILYAVTHPTRGITVGGAGGAMIWLTRLFPALADHIYYHAARGDRPPRPGALRFTRPGERGMFWVISKAIYDATACIPTNSEAVG